MRKVSRGLKRRKPIGRAGPLLCRATVLSFVCCVAVVRSAPALATPSQGDQTPPRVGEIEIEGHEVFEEHVNTLTPLYRLANKLHIRTRQSVIRREVLFAPGGDLKPELLAQTERNLRALPFLRDARVESSPIDEDGDGRAERVNTRVVTWDAWTTSPLLTFTSVGGRRVWEVGASEQNLFGFGKEVRGSRRKDLDRTTTSVLYRDRQLAGSRLLLTASVAQQSDGQQGLLLLEHPFYSLDDTWAGGLSVGAFTRRDPLFFDGSEVTQLRHVARWADLEVARAVRRRPTQALRVHFAYRVREDTVGTDVRDFGILEVGVSSTVHRFVRLTHLSQFERAEDLNLGAESAVAVGISAPRLGGGRGVGLFLSVAQSRGFQFGPGHLLIGSVSSGARHHLGQWENVLTGTRIRYLRKHALRHALVGTAEFRHGAKLDPEVQLLLGAETGLRGYPVRQFAGTRALLLTAEERWFVADDLGQLFSVGGAVFVDSGFAWPEDRHVDLADLRTSVGVGLLVGRNRLSRSVPGLRFDLAYALKPVSDKGRWVFTAGSAIEF